MSWRDTLFIWRGDLVTTITTTTSDVSATKTHPQSNQSVFSAFEGRWVGVHAVDACDATMPTNDEFDSSDSAFHVTAESKDVEFESLSYVCGTGWELDQGDGAGNQWYRDDVHVVKMIDDGDVVIATGRNAFAPFVSAGVLSGYAYRKETLKEDITGTIPRERTQITTRRKMTLARRYLDHRDARCKWNAHDRGGELERAVREAAAAAEEEAEAAAAAAKEKGEKPPPRRGHYPWMTEAMSSKRMSSKAVTELLSRKRKRC